MPKYPNSARPASWISPEVNYDDQIDIAGLNPEMLHPAGCGFRSDPETLDPVVSDMIE